MWWNCWFWVLNNIHTYIRTNSIPLLWEWYCALGFFFSRMTAALRAAEILLNCFPGDAAQWAGLSGAQGLAGLAARAALRRVPSPMEALLEVVCSGWAALCVWGLSAGWVWGVSVLNTIPEAALLWSISSITTGKYWIFDVCLAESSHSFVFCTTCIGLIPACFPPTLSSLTTCCGLYKQDDVPKMLIMDSCKKGLTELPAVAVYFKRQKYQ